MLFLNLIILIYCGLFCTDDAHCDKLQVISDCACPGSNITYECAINGGGITVWSAPECSDIFLPHSDFLAHSGSCMNGQVVWNGKSIEGSCYTSVLTIINVSVSVSGQTVMCSLDDGNPTTTSVGNTTILVAQGMFTRYHNNNY